MAHAETAPLGLKRDLLARAADRHGLRPLRETGRGLDRTALVTGGASGIVLALVHALMAEGAERVVVLGRDEARPAATAAEFGPRAELTTNPDAVVALSASLLLRLARQPSAAKVNVTSGLALAPRRSSPVYCTAKTGARAFTQALRYRSEDRLPHVRIVEARPPIVDTPLTAGRGRGKIGAGARASAIVSKLKAGRTEIDMGGTRLLRVILRLPPALARRVMRNG